VQQQQVVSTALAAAGNTTTSTNSETQVMHDLLHQTQIELASNEQTR
jgi:hypothetical protein